MTVRPVTPLVPVRGKGHLTLYSGGRRVGKMRALVLEVADALERGDRVHVAFVGPAGECLIADARAELERRRAA